MKRPLRSSLSAPNTQRLSTSCCFLITVLRVIGIGSRSSSTRRLRSVRISVSPLGSRVATTFSESIHDWAGVKGSLLKAIRSAVIVVVVKAICRA